MYTMNGTIALHGQITNAQILFSTAIDGIISIQEFETCHLRPPQDM